MLESTIAYNGITMNDQTKRSLGVAPFYFIRVQSVDESTDVRYEAHNIPSADHERSGDVFYGGKSITISGEIIALNMTILRIGIRAMQQAFWDLEKHDLVFTPFGEPQLKINCRVSQPLDFVEEQPDDRHARRFTVTLRADDGRTRRVSDSTVYPTFQT